MSKLSFAVLNLSLKFNMNPMKLFAKIILKNVPLTS
jgi:hypothetical protein